MRASEEGVPQGGSISPVLANVYLHYALDLWFEKVYGKSCKGKTRLIRYADDFVVCFVSKEDAMKFKAELKKKARGGVRLDIVDIRKEQLTGRRFISTHRKRFLEPVVRNSLHIRDAYNMIPGRDPQNG